MNYKELMDFCLSDSPENLPPNALGEVFSRLIWTSSDNGKEIVNIRDSWIKSKEKQKVLVALHIDEVLFNPSDLEEALKNHPDLSQIIESVATPNK